MQYSELINLYFERSNALQWYWTLYVVIVGGLLAFSSLRQRKDAVTGVLVTVLFIFFAYKNCDAIHDTTVQRLAVLQAIKELPASGTGSMSPQQVVNQRDAIVATLNPPAWDGVRKFHVASDVITVLALWAMELRRRRMAAEQAQA